MKKTSFHIIEIVFGILLGIIIVIGIICEVMVHCGCPQWIIPDLRNFTMVVLQIEAGVSTLVVALVALISGMIGEEVYGIGVTNYYMRVRPRFFKQQVIIIVTVSLIFAGVIAELFECYNMVFALFFCEWILIIASVIEVLPILTENYKKEIREYLDQEMDNGNYKLISNCLESYKFKFDACNYDDDVLWKCLESLLKKNTDEAISVLNNDWCAMLRTYLTSDDEKMVKCGLEFLQETYRRMWKFILLNKDKCELNGVPRVFDSLYNEYRTALDHLPIEELEEIFNLDEFSENVSHVNSWYLRNNQEEYAKSCRHVEKLSQYTGYLLGKKLRSTSKSLSEIDRNYWGKMLKRQNICGYNIPKDLADEYLLHRCRVYLGYAVSLIIGGHKELFETYYLQSDINRTSIHGVYFRLSVACYLYYLAEVESKYLVPNEAKQCADYVLSSESFKEQLTSLLHWVNWKQKINDFQLFFETTLQEWLSPFERYKEGQAKQLVIEPTVNLFSVFIQCYVSDRYHLGVLFVKKTNNENITTQILKFLEGEKREKTKGEFRKLYKLMIRTHFGIDTIQRADNLFYWWEKVVLERYKNDKMARAYNTQSIYEKENIEEVLKTDTQKHLLEHFHERFDILYDQTITIGEELTFNLMKFVSDTEFLLKEKSLSIVYDNLDSLLVENIAQYLLDKKKVTFYDRSQKSDVEFIDDMENTKIVNFVGSEFELIEKELENWKTIKSFKDSRENVFIGGTNTLLALVAEGLKFSIRDINVSVHDPLLDENDEAEYIEETGLYRIKIINDIAVMFGKEEADNYIKNQRKVADICVKVMIKVPDTRVGFWITNSEV